MRFSIFTTLLTCSALTLSACGGGGGNSPAAFVPPPVAPAPPTPPVSAEDPDLTQNKLLSNAEMETPAISPPPAVNADYQTWLDANHHPIRSVTYADDFSDLAFLKDEIGARSLVQLGESSHGTAEFNHVKTRLIKYLHQEMGFSVIAFESGFFEGHYSDSIRETQSATSLMRFTFGVWHTDEVLELFDYVKATQSGPNPLRLIGFDIQMSSPYFTQVENFVADLPATDTMTDELKAELSRDLLQARSLQTEYAEQSCFNNRSGACESAVETMAIVSARLEDLETRILAIQDPDRDTRILALTLFQARGQLDYSAVHYAQGLIASSTQRDLGMATMVNRIRETIYPDEKIAIWAHNAHIAHSETPLRRISGNLNLIEQPLGFHLKNDRPDELFTIGLYMLRGSTADNSGRSLFVQRPLDNSLEAIAHSVRTAAFYVNTQSGQPRVDGNEFLFARTDAHYWGGAFGAYSMIPSDQYDGLIMIDKSSTPTYR